jgi:hypothetical protein
MSCEKGSGEGKRGAASYEKDYFDDDVAGSACHISAGL